MRTRQRGDGSQFTMFFAQFVDGAKIQRTQRTGLDADGLFAVCNTIMAAITLGHMSFCSIVLWRTVRAGHMTVATANAHVFIDHHKTILTLMHRTTWTNLGAGRILAVVTGD